MKSFEVASFIFNLEQLDKEKIFSATEELLNSQVDDEVLFDVFEELIKHEDHLLREIAAYALGRLEYNEALPLLKEAYFKAPFNRRSRYVYAMNNLDCAKEVKFLVQACLEANFETQNHAINILTDEDQDFLISKEECNELLDLIHKNSNLDISSELEKIVIYFLDELKNER